MTADITSIRRHPTTSRCHSYGLSLASVPFYTPDRQHGTLCRTAFALNQTLQSFGNILKLTFSVQHLTFVNFYSLILLIVDSVMHLCPFCNRRIINVPWWWWWWWYTSARPDCQAEILCSRPLFVHPCSVTKHVDTIFWQRMTPFWCQLAQVVMEQGRESMNFGDQEVKGQGDMRLKIHLEAWWRLLVFLVFV